MLAFDIGANRGDWTHAAILQNYRVIALEPGKIFGQLVKNFIYNDRVTPLKMAVSNKDWQTIDFYEADEDGLSSINEKWLTDPSLPYAGKSYRTTSCTTITIDTLFAHYGAADLIKIDVEGAEWSVLHGMTKHHGELTFEWTSATMDEHEAQLDYLYEIGYRVVAPQFIMPHLVRPRVYLPLRENNKGRLFKWHEDNAEDWVDGGWRNGNLRPTADVGMIWLR